MSRRWTMEELRTLAKERGRDLTFPQIQQKHFPGRTVSAVRSATRTKKYKDIAREVQDDSGVITAGEGPDRFRFPGIELTLSADSFAALVRSYVASGGDLTRSQTAREIGITEEQMDHICRSYGLTKDSPPVPLELMAQKTDDEIVKATLDARAEGIKDKVDAKRARYFEKQYRKLAEELQLRECVLDRLDRFIDEHKDKFGAESIDKDHLNPRIHAAHIPVADAHLGNLAWEPEVGADYDIHIGADRLAQHGEWAKKQLGMVQGVKVAYVTDVGDLFHAILSQTESGTALDKDTRDLKVFDMAFEAKVSQIESIRQVAEKVVVIGVPGNHDHIFVPLFNRMLKHHYDSVSDVEVRDVYGHFAGFVVGETAHLLDHGTGVSKLTGWKAKATLVTVEKHALEASERDQVRESVYYCGHKHELQVDSYTEMELRRLPALGEPDDYTVSLRFSGRAGAELYLLSEAGRIERIHRFYPD